ncbi:ATP-binding protein [Fulvivirgaceae bacterium BMA10]|uniref:ATP-binding protein n=1 Tax=Splendidivirga corallicola TaxID=3051826 RepID=A0ABT8KWU6_9BACT|nr:ATP-binding protein [Fulvivirgaceae bacterium BMA10]
MTLKEVQVLASQGEHETLEFKRKVAHPEKIVREVVAFANTKGGKLLIGIDDNGSVPGLKFAREDQFSLNKAIKKLCKPSIKYNSEIVPISAKRAVISYEIFESEKKPHYVIEDTITRKGKAYVRVEDKSLQASKEVREILKRGKRTKGVKFHFGRKEKLLMEHLDKNTSITIKEFQHIASLPKYIASKTLIQLVLANVLSVKAEEGEDHYFAKIPD